MDFVIAFSNLFPFPQMGTKSQRKASSAEMWDQIYCEPRLRRERGNLWTLPLKFGLGLLLTCMKLQGCKRKNRKPVEKSFNRACFQQVSLKFMLRSLKVLLMPTHQSQMSYRDPKRASDSLGNARLLIPRYARYRDRWNLTSALNGELITSPSAIGHFIPPSYSLSLRSLSRAPNQDIKVDEDHAILAAEMASSGISKPIPRHIEDIQEQLLRQSQKGRGKLERNVSARPLMRRRATRPHGGRSKQPVSSISGEVSDKRRRLTGDVRKSRSANSRSVRHKTSMRNFTSPSIVKSKSSAVYGTVGPVPVEMAKKHATYKRR